MYPFSPSVDSSRFKNYFLNSGSRISFLFNRRAKNATIIYSALLAMLAIVLQALLLGNTESLRKIGMYRY